MDAFGWPGAEDCIGRLQLIAPDDVTSAVAFELQKRLAQVVAHFQGPVGANPATGGTGRTFQRAVATRTYDGTGFPDLIIDDIDPDSPFSVTLFGTIVTDFGVKEEQDRKGFHVLYRQQGGVYLTGFPYRAVWSLGKQNVAVTATFGLGIDVNVFNAIIDEACYRTLVSGFVGLNGIGEDVKIGDFEVNTSVGAINFKLTSPLTVMHDSYRTAIDQFRVNAAHNFKRLVRRMS